jgi:type IV secretion system protein VirB2
VGQSHRTNIKPKKNIGFAVFSVWFGVAVYAMPMAVFAQASPFNTGATSLLSFALTIATPIAAIIVIGLAIAAAVGKISWGWVIGAIVGIAAIFGAPQIVTWIRGLFGV